MSFWKIKTEEILELENLKSFFKDILAGSCSHLWEVGDSLSACSCLVAPARILHRPPHACAPSSSQLATHRNMRDCDQDQDQDQDRDQDRDRDWSWSWSWSRSGSGSWVVIDDPKCPSSILFVDFGCDRAWLSTIPVEILSLISFAY